MPFGGAIIGKDGKKCISQEEALSYRVALVLIEQCLLPRKNGTKLCKRDRLEAIKFHVERALQREIGVEQ